MLLLLLFFLRGFFFFFFLCSFLSSVFGPGWPWPAHCGRLAVAVAVAGWPEAKKIYCADQRTSGSADQWISRLAHQRISGSAAADHADQRTSDHNKSVYFRARVSYKCVLQECPIRVSYKISHKRVLQDSSARVPHKSVQQECPTRVSHKSDKQECPTRVSHKNVLQE